MLFCVWLVGGFRSLRRGEGATWAGISYGWARTVLFAETYGSCESLVDAYSSSMIEKFGIIMHQFISVSHTAISPVSKPQSSERPIQLISSKILTCGHFGISSRMFFLLIHKIAIWPLHSRHPCHTGFLRFKYFLVSIQPTWGNPSFFRKLLLLQLPLPLLDSLLCVFLHLLYMFLQCLACCYNFFRGRRVTRLGDDVFLSLSASTGIGC